MMNFLRKHQFKIFLFTITVFLLGTFIGFGGYFFASKGGPSAAIASVDGEGIPLRVFLSHYRRALDQVQPGKTPDKATLQIKRDETLRDMVQSAVFAREAARYGIRVPDQQVAVSLTQAPAFQEKGSFSYRVYLEALQSQIRMSPKDFEEEQRRSIAFFKLRWLIQSAIKVTDREADMMSAARNAAKPLKTQKEKSVFRQQLWQEKVMHSFNEWFSRIGRDLKVKTHFELLEGAR